MMTTREKECRVAELENKRFMLAMKDVWDYRDFELDRQLFNEWLKLKKELDNNTKK